MPPYGNKRVLRLARTDHQSDVKRAVPPLMSQSTADVLLPFDNLIHIFYILIKREKYIGHN